MPLRLWLLLACFTFAAVPVTACADGPTILVNRKPKVLAAADADAMRGRTIAIRIGAAPAFSLYGGRFLGTPEEIALLQSRFPGAVPGKVERDQAWLPATAIPDPAPEIAQALVERLVAQLGLVPVPSGTTADVIVDVQTTLWQAYDYSALTPLWFVYGAGVSVRRVDGTPLVGAQCSYWNREASTQLPRLTRYFADDMTMLRRDLHGAATACANKFAEKALNLPAAATVASPTAAGFPD